MPTPMQPVFRATSATNYALTIAPTDCGNSGCHLTTWQQTNAPPHASAGTTFAAANCATCHTTVNFTTATFDHWHDRVCLDGLHMSPSPSPCISCHVSNNYTLTSTACYGCHITSWQSTRNTRRRGAKPYYGRVSNGLLHLPHDLSLDGRGIYHTATGFPLTGFHATVACAGCHVNNNYSITVTTCVSCHLNKYTATTTPNHVQVGVPPDLRDLPHHGSLDRRDFDHNTTTFPLTGYSRHVGSLCELPREQQLYVAANHLLRLPHGNIQRHNESGSRGSRVPDNLCHLPHDGSLDRRNIQSHLFPR